MDGIINNTHGKSWMNVRCSHTKMKVQVKELETKSVSAHLQTLFTGGRKRPLTVAPLENMRSVRI